MNRVLVTGATGGIGQSLVRALLDRGVEVVATGRNPQAGARLAAAGAAFRAADLAEDALEPLLQGVGVVFHLAARSSPWGPRQAFERDNVVATRRLLDAAEAGGARRFVFTSTPSIFSERRDRLQLTEGSPVARVFSGHYAATKFAAEGLALGRNRPGFAVTVIRPKAVIGPDDAVLLPRLVRVAERRAFPLPRGGEALIELTDVRDVASALLAAAREDAPGGVAVNISGGQPRPFRDIAAAACRAAQLPFRPLALPEALFYGAAVAAESAARLTGREPSLTRHSAMAVSWSQTFDLTGARKWLDWSPAYSPEAAMAYAAGDGGAP